MATRWFGKTFNANITPTGYDVLLTTDVPCHLWLYYTFQEPWVHRSQAIKRGLSIPWHSYWCYVAWQKIEQDEAGDTTSHTFNFSPLYNCLNVWFRFAGTIATIWSPSDSPIFYRHYLDYDYNDGPNNIARAINEYEARCQSFKPLYTYNLKYINVKLRREGNPLPLEVRIYRSLLTGIPFGHPIFETTIDPDNISTSPTYDWHPIFAKYLVVGAGIVYTLMLTNQSTWPGNNIYVTGQIHTPTDEYSRGHWLSYLLKTDQWLPDTNVDMNFKLEPA